MYRALYRKWRPQRFEDVVGQRAIVTALKNQITANRVGHAYLFTGVRGTGKTTCAKIFAKAVNCLHPVNGDPCGECEICKGIDNGSILDVVEMDAASNNGVDDIRDLRDETAYTPSACKYKVYIIDEVHMLSTAAFNALLKTLEEPPAHVIFILATTEIQKVPATILSRCQRYDFTRIGPEDIARRVEYIAGEEKLELSPDGAELIARLADGALRDALSILDTCAGVTAKIDADVVRRMAGVTDRSYLFRISDALEAQDGATALAQLAQLRQQSVDVKRLTEELIAHYRALMLAALPGGQSLLSGVSPEEEAFVSGKRPAAWPAGGHSCHPCAGQCAGTYDPRQRPADRAGTCTIWLIRTAPAAAGSSCAGRACPCCSSTRSAAAVCLGNCCAALCKRSDSPAANTVRSCGAACSGTETCKGRTFRAVGNICRADFTRPDRRAAAAAGVNRPCSRLECCLGTSLPRRPHSQLHPCRQSWNLFRSQNRPNLHPRPLQSLCRKSHRMPGRKGLCCIRTGRRWYSSCRKKIPCSTPICASPRLTLMAPAC